VTEAGRFYGKYRGTVSNNVDPERKGRIQVEVPDVLGSSVSSWALPCVPFAGTQSGFFVVPAMGAAVWVEFEQGNPDYPIWVGGFWGQAGELPSLSQSVTPGTQAVVMTTQAQNTLMVSDVPGPTGGIMLRTSSGALLTINDIGITISNGKGATVTLNGPSVSVNNGALMVQ
jgi:uncharacterized protein involved in type VI secretion and phage assembly